MPDRVARRQILEIRARSKPLTSDVDLEKVTDLIECSSGADLVAVVNTAVYSLKNDTEMTVDSHEPDYIAALLVQLGVDVERKTITPGDYVLSSDCAVERKTVDDFINSMFSGRLFEQAPWHPACHSYWGPNRRN